MIVYATTWCPYCRSLLSALKKTDMVYDVVDVDEDREAAAWVESVNDGNRIIPTVLYSDGTHETNPPASSVRNKQKELAES